MRGFPTKALAAIRCPKDGAPFKPLPNDSHSIVDGEVCCSHCEAVYPVEGGILRFLNRADLDKVNAENLETFERNSAVENFEHESIAWSLKDMAPTIAALGDIDGKNILESGCGNGRFTVRL